MLSQSIKNKRKLEIFSIMKSKINNNQMLSILDSLTTCSNLKVLNLSKNSLKHCYSALANMLKTLQFIEVVALNNCQIGPNRIPFILQALKDKNCLKELYLSGNEIGDEGIKNLNYLFPDEFTSLRALNLSYNNITENGAEFLSNFLRSKSQLEYLQLSYNKLRAKGVYYILSACSKIDKLKDFDLANNEIGNEGSIHIELYVMKIKNLMNLNVMNNEISEERMIAIQMLLNKQSTICKTNAFNIDFKKGNNQEYFNMNMQNQNIFPIFHLLSSSFITIDGKENSNDSMESFEHQVLFKEENGSLSFDSDEIPLSNYPKEDYVNNFCQEGAISLIKYVKEEEEEEEEDEEEENLRNIITQWGMLCLKKNDSKNSCIERENITLAISDILCSQNPDKEEENNIKDT